MSVGQFQTSVRVSLRLVLFKAEKQQHEGSVFVSSWVVFLIWL